MKKESKKLTILQVYKIYNIVSIVFFSLLGLDFIGLILAFALIKNEVFLIILVAILAFLALVLALGGYLFVRRAKILLYDDLYLGMRNNIKLFMHRKKLFNSLPDHHFAEASELNEMFDDISRHFATLCLEDSSLSDSDVKLEYEKGSRTIVTYQSLVDNISLILQASKYFRNAFVHLSYALGSETIKDKDAEVVIKNIKKALNYSGMLISEEEKKKGFLLYVPRIDSISQFREELDQLLKSISLLKHNPQGSEMVLCHAAVVIYPYSRADQILEDLKFATRQNKVLNIYLPNAQLGKNPYFLESDMNSSQMSKFIESFTSLHIEAKNLHSSRHRLNKLINQVADYFCFTCAGLIEFEDDSDSFVSQYSYSSTNSHIFPEGVTINSELINVLNEVKDSDHSYYFSSRKHLNNKIAPYIDIYCIKSGLFYILNNGGDKAAAILYFFNDDKELNLDTYLRESLLVFAYIISCFVKSIRETNFSLLNRTRFRDIVRLSNIKLYSVAKNSHRLTFISDALMDEIPSAKKHRTCYKALYGRSTPCEDCPMTSKHSLIQPLGKIKYETTIVLHNDEDDSVHMFMQPMSDNFRMDRFDRNTLTNSYYSYIDNLNNAWLGGVRGYALYLSITNISALIERDGNEGYAFVLRNFSRQLRDSTGQMSLFLYRDNVLCLTLPSYNRHSIIDIVEKIYEMSKQTKTLNGEDYPLQITYIASHYPQDYKSVEEFNNAMEKIFPQYMRDEEPDLLHFPETGHTRRASKMGYLLSVIDDSFNKKTFQIKLQPVVNNVNWRMIGAELLLRLRDDYRDITLNTNEIVKVAEDNNRVGTMSDALLTYVGELYNRHGYSFFKSMGLSRLSFNTDFSYFDNSSFIEKLGSLATKNSIPKGFLALEISEEDVANHLEGYSAITPRIIKTDTDLICDRYTGEFVSLQMLKDLGFTEIKISQSIVVKIGEDTSYLNKVVTIYHHAMLLGLRVTLVGIEDKANYDIVKDECHNCSIQGKYFYDPLEEDGFLEALRKCNV